VRVKNLRKSYKFEFSNPLNQTNYEREQIYIYIDSKKLTLQKIVLVIIGAAEITFYNRHLQVFGIKHLILIFIYLILDEFPTQYFELGVNCEPASEKVEDMFWKFFQMIIRFL